MKQLLGTGTALLLIHLYSYSQTTIPAAEAAKHTGKQVTICDKVFGGRYFANATGAPTLINMGAAYPDNPFTFVIQGNNRKKFTYTPEEFLLNKQVCVTGEVTEFKGKPQIIVSDTTQVAIKN